MVAVTIGYHFIQNFTHELLNVSSSGEARSRYIQDFDRVCFGKDAELGAPIAPGINVQTRPIHLVCPLLSGQRSPGQPR